MHASRHAVVVSIHRTGTGTAAAAASGAVQGLHTMCTMYPILRRWGERAGSWVRLEPSKNLRGVPDDELDGGLQLVEVFPVPHLLDSEIDLEL